MKPDDLDLDVWLREADRDFVASVADELDLDLILDRVQRTAAELKVRQAAASTAAGGLVMGPAAVRIGRLFRGNPDVWFDDLQICDSTGLSPGSTYSVIRQFVDAGWLEDRWETGVEEDEPRRKFYRTTADGVTGLGLIIAEYEQTQRAGESALNRLLGKRRPKEA
jgi:hypothetical protein